MKFILITTCIALLQQCQALQLQQQVMLQSAISYLETQFEDLTNVTKPECKAALLETFHAAKSYKYWALKIVDAIPKIPSGILQGNIRDFGNFDECLSAHNEDSSIKGKYCLVNMVFTASLTNEVLRNASKQFKTDVVDLNRFNLNTVNNTLNFFGINNVMSWGFCAPHACDGQDITAMFDHLIYGNFEEPYLRLTTADNYCQTIDPPPMPLRAMLAMIGFGLVFLMVGASTTYDVLVYQKKKFGQPDLFISFSLLTNGRKLFLEKREDSMSALYGIRTVGCIIVVVTHLCQLNSLLPTINTADVVDYDTYFSIRSIVFTGAPLTVDSFLIVSGLLLSYNFLKEAQTEEKKLSGIPSFYMHRLIRLSPPLIAITVYQWCIFKWMGNGPAAISFKGFTEDNCNTYWWTSMLYVSNYVKPIGSCVPHAWYLSVDMQLFLISPIFLFTLLRKPKLGYALISLTILASSAYSIYIFHLYRLSVAAADIYSMPGDTYFKVNYVATHVRMVPWLFGLMYGHFLHTNLAKRLLNHFSNAVGWFGAISTFFYFLITYHSYSIKIQGMTFMSIYYALNRPLWALSVAFIVYSCKMGYGGLINYISSLNVLRILSNLSYSMYLTHVCAVLVVVGTRWTSSYLSDMRNFLDLCSSYSLTLFSAIPFALCFEYPFVAIESYFKKRGKQIELNKTLDISMTTVQTLEMDNNDIVNNQKY